MRLVSIITCMEADKINDLGHIVGGTVQLSTGEVHAFLATPSKWEGDLANAKTAAPAERPKVTLPENVRKLLQRREGFGGLKGGLVTLR